MMIDLTNFNVFHIKSTAFEDRAKRNN